MPGCDAERTHCIGIVLHVAPESGAEDAAPVISAEQVAAHLAEANRHFAPVEVGFELAEVRWLEPGEREVETRRDRDRLGRKRFGRGVVHVFMVGRLANVDEEGEIYGVHWRDRDDRSRRWIIVSAIAWRTTLAHELGHFFGLPHSEYAISIMNKSPRDEPPWEERTFHDDELAVMAKQRDKMLDKGQLVARTPPLAEGR